MRAPFLYPVTFLVFIMAESKLLEPGQKLKPSICNDEVVGIIQDLYRQQVTGITELNSYDDRNFLIQTDGGAKFIFKISNFLDSSTPGLIGKIQVLNISDFCRQFEQVTQPT